MIGIINAVIIIVNIVMDQEMIKIITAQNVEIHFLNLKRQIIKIIVMKNVKTIIILIMNINIIVQMINHVLLITQK